jgi:hypothetical protein
MARQNSAPCSLHDPTAVDTHPRTRFVTLPTLLMHFCCKQLYIRPHTSGWVGPQISCYPPAFKPGPTQTKACPRLQHALYLESFQLPLLAPNWITKARSTMGLGSTLGTSTGLRS